MTAINKCRRQKIKEMNFSALNKMNCDRKILAINYHFILCMRESIKQNTEFE